jgi:hypothetical protein
VHNKKMEGSEQIVIRSGRDWCSRWDGRGEKGVGGWWLGR